MPEAPQFDIAADAGAMAARKIRDKAKKIAAYLLEASEEDLEWEPGKFSVKGVPGKSKTIQDIAFAAYTNVPPGLEAGLEAFLQGLDLRTDALENGRRSLRVDGLHQPAGLLEPGQILGKWNQRGHLAAPRLFAVKQRLLVFDLAPE